MSNRVLECLVLMQDITETGIKNDINKITWAWLLEAKKRDNIIQILREFTSI